VSTAVILFAHGSPLEAANEAVRQLAREVGAETAFLEPAHPTLPEAVNRLAACGTRRIVVVPYFLTLGLHMERDLPRIVDELRSVHEGMEIRVTPPLDGHPALAGIIRDRVAGELA
jgi:sirohydrochlorin ferrochelatase